MSARYGTISGMLGLVEPAESSAASSMEKIEVLPEPARRTRKRDSLRKISVRHLVSKLETRAAETLERNFGGRFSGRLRKGKLGDEATPGATSSSSGGVPVPDQPSSSSARTWYMVPLSAQKSSSNQSADCSAAASSLSLSSSMATDDNNSDNSDDTDVQWAVIGRDKISADTAEFSQR
ncbi:AGAP011558-PA [Anopheles gambiae str. PEST]|nr:AGAP011558-PA [Anopheles gambiae str. PEST]